MYAIFELNMNHEQHKKTLYEEENENSTFDAFAVPFRLKTVVIILQTTQNVMA